jgi:hypothetical protein
VSNNDGGTVTPNGAAVFRLMTGLNGVPFSPAHVFNLPNLDTSPLRL